MKNKKGFTLIEIIVTIALLAILSLIIILNLNSNLKKQKAKDYQIFVDKIKAATNIYWSSDKNLNSLIETKDYIIISVEELANTGLISMETLIDPESNLSLNDSSEEKKYVKIYKDQSGADFIEYPIKDISDLFYTITYELNGGTGCENDKVLKGQAKELCTPKTEAKADFDGWYIDSTLKNEVTSPYTPTSNVTLYAKWKHYYSINYNVESAYENLCKDLKIYEGESHILCSPTKEHHTLEGWYDSSSLINKIGNAGNSISPTKDLVLHPNWVRNIYEIRFNLNGGTNGKCTDADLADRSIDGGNELGTLCEPTMGDNYDFRGWNTKADGTGKYYVSTDKPEQSMTLYAIFIRKTYIITYQNGPKCTYKTVNAGAEVGALCQPEWEDHRFKGWYTNSTGGTEFSEKNKLNGNITIYAQWELIVPSPPTLTFNTSSIANGDSVIATLKWLTSDVVTDYCITSLPNPLSCSWISAPSSGTVSKSIKISGSPGAKINYYGFLKNESEISQPGTNDVTIKQTTVATTPATTVAPCSSTYSKKEWGNCFPWNGQYWYSVRMCKYSNYNDQLCECGDWVASGDLCNSGSSGGSNCYKGGVLKYRPGEFTCTNVCERYYDLVKFGPMSDGSYDWGCYSGHYDLGSYCAEIYCPI